MGRDLASPSAQNAIDNSFLMDDSDEASITTWPLEARSTAKLLLAHIMQFAVSAEPSNTTAEEPDVLVNENSTSK